MTCDQCTTLYCSDLADNCGAVTGCDVILACIVDTGCGMNSTRDTKECYCGDNVDDQTCFGFDPTAPQGECKADMNAAAPGGPLAVGSVFFDVTSPVGAAVQETGCRRGFCQTECGL